MDIIFQSEYRWEWLFCMRAPKHKTSKSAHLFRVTRLSVVPSSHLNILGMPFNVPSVWQVPRPSVHPFRPEPLQGPIQDFGKEGGAVDRVAVVRGRSPSLARGGGSRGMTPGKYWTFRVSEMAFPAFWESKMFDFTVCEQQNLADSLFVETPELEKYLKKLVPWRKGGLAP